MSCVHLNTFKTSVISYECQATWRNIPHDMLVIYGHLKCVFVCKERSLFKLLCHSINHCQPECVSLHLFELYDFMWTPGREGGKSTCIKRLYLWLQNEYKLWNKCQLESLSRNFPIFKELECSLQCPQKPTTGHNLKHINLLQVLILFDLL